jgi:hypothetical protein
MSTMGRLLTAADTTQDRRQATAAVDVVPLFIPAHMVLDSKS